jgi:uncharacterized protein
MASQGISNDVHKTFRIRTIAGFVNIRKDDFSSAGDLEGKIVAANKAIRSMEMRLIEDGYEVQTVRIVTNPFGEWLEKEIMQNQLAQLDELLERLHIQFCALGPADNVDEIRLCPAIISASSRFSCSANVSPTQVVNAKAAASCFIQLSTMEEPDFLKGGLGNFRFCATASCKPWIPFFPAAKSSSNFGDGFVGFAIGLENGALAKTLLSKSCSIENISTIFGEGMTVALAPVQKHAEEVALHEKTTFLGIDTSLNPSLDAGGSVAEAIECLEEVSIFGGSGTLAAVAAITMTLQTLPSIKAVGYCGLMLPVCEDRRLAEIASNLEPKLRISTILSMSSVCGVGVDTVPIPGDCSETDLSSLILDVAGLAGRWDKSLSCRVFPIAGSKVGDMTEFDSPYLCNSKVFAIQ